MSKLLRMTQKQTFLKNLLDSTLSISLDHVVYNEKMVSFALNDKTITGDIFKFRYKLSGEETKFMFDVYLYKVKKTGWFGSDKSEYYLAVETRQSTQYSSTWISTDTFTSKDSDLLKKMFDFLFNRIEEKRFVKEESDYQRINIELVKLIDKSLTRDEKLEDLLKK